MNGKEFLFLSRLEFRLLGFYQRASFAALSASGAWHGRGYVTACSWTFCKPYNVDIEHAVSYAEVVEAIRYVPLGMVTLAELPPNIIPLLPASFFLLLL